ncbi:MAG TPA: hypothetical protein VHW01_29585 [Polyangiaceae bacterium]|nr:hypothetical protein [Polyangiaceae bacterium]
MKSLVVNERPYISSEELIERLEGTFAKLCGDVLKCGAQVIRRESSSFRVFELLGGQGDRGSKRTSVFVAADRAMLITDLRLNPLKLGCVLPALKGSGQMPESGRRRVELPTPASELLFL